MIRVVLVDDHPEVRRTLRGLLARDDRFEVVGEAGNGEEAVRLAHLLAPDVVVMDIVMPTVDGIEATRRIVSAHPEVKVLALSMFAERRFAEEMLFAGASGYLLKERAGRDLRDALDDVAAGGACFDYRLA